MEDAFPVLIRDIVYSIQGGVLMISVFYIPSKYLHRCFADCYKQRTLFWKHYMRHGNFGPRRPPARACSTIAECVNTLFPRMFC